MKEVSAVLATQKTSVKSNFQEPAGAKGKVFKQILSNVTESKPDQKNVFQEITELQQKLISGNKIPPKELLLYQIKAGQFGLRVELVSKVADSALSTARKLQGSQG